MGIEPTSSAWEAEVLPLNYTRGVLDCIERPIITTRGGGLKADWLFELLPTGVGGKSLAVTIGETLQTGS